ncbi:hypothetical protein E3N88_18648 [Mikania micrantha]|uniref:Uncharacterized protein n=1 Tax=Mikania micrantha TaxID=192012 RepID=A0A5N6NL40_9ASTR|nr:hypothetical protein E3N88_18648 [Mikania micrantha]
MSPAIEKPSRIHHIIRVRQMLRRWRRRSSSSSPRRLVATDVPAGHVAICVGSNFRRFVVRATYLNHPIFQKLLAEAEEEYGFSTIGTLRIPCEESEFEEILRRIKTAPSWIRLLKLKMYLSNDRSELVTESTRSEY